MEIKIIVEVKVVVKLDVVMEEKVGQLEGENTNTSQVMGISHLLKVLWRSAETSLAHNAR